MHKTLTINQARKLVGKFGSPLFVTYKETIIDNIKSYRENFKKYPGGFTLAYSAKTNPIIALLEIFKKEDVVVEVCSMSDINASLLAGYKGKKIIYAGLFKPDDSLEKAVKNNISLISVESLDEAMRLSKIAKNLKKKVNVSIRLSFPSSKVGFKALLGMSYGRFGTSITMGEAQAVAQYIVSDDYLDLVGLHCHTGSNQKNAKHYLIGIDELVGFMVYLKERYGLSIKSLNLGGGFGLSGITEYQIYDFFKQALARLLNNPFSFKNEPLDFENMSTQIINYLTKKIHKNKLEFPHLILEPGRSLVGNSTHLIATIVGVKKTEKNYWLIIDAGTNLMPILTLYSEYHKIDVLSRNNKRKRISIAGPLLYSADIVAQDRLLPIGKIGDLVIIYDVGAYFNCQANQFLYPRAATVLVDDNQVDIIQRRETYEDLFLRDL